MSATALLIVDVQNDFTEGGSLAVAGGHAIAGRITRFLLAHAGRYAVVIASRDWHDAVGDNGGHFAHGIPDFTHTWPVHCVAGTPGAEYDPGFDPSWVTHHVKKGQGRPAYSLFEGIGDDGRTTRQILDDEAITEVDAVGIATDYCVRASALDALAAGRRVRILTDLVAGVAAETSRAALKELATAGARLAPSGLAS